MWTICCCYLAGVKTGYFSLNSRRVERTQIVKTLRYSPSSKYGSTRWIQHFASNYRSQQTAGNNESNGCSCISAYLCSTTLPGDVGLATKRWAMETIEFAWWQHSGAVVRSVTSQHGRSWDGDPAGSRPFLCGVFSPLIQLLLQLSFHSPKLCKYYSVTLDCP